MASTATGIQARFETVQATRPLAAVGWIGDIERAAECLLPTDALDFHAPEVEEGREGLSIPDLDELGNVIVHSESLGIASSLGHLAAEAHEKAPDSFKRPASLKIKGLKIITELGETLEDEVRTLVAVIKQEKRLRAEKLFMDKFIRGTAERHLDVNHLALKIPLARLNRGYSMSNDSMDRLTTHMPGRIIAERGKIEPVTLELAKR